MDVSQLIRNKTECLKVGEGMKKQKTEVKDDPEAESHFQSPVQISFPD